MRLRDIMIAVLIVSLFLGGWLLLRESILPAPRVSVPMIYSGGVDEIHELVVLPSEDGSKGILNRSKSVPW